MVVAEHDRRALHLLVGRDDHVDQVAGQVVVDDSKNRGLVPMRRAYGDDLNSQVARLLTGAVRSGWTILPRRGRVCVFRKYLLR